jgi:hypothetical protein
VTGFFEEERQRVEEAGPSVVRLDGRMMALGANRRRLASVKFRFWDHLTSC